LDLRPPWRLSMAVAIDFFRRLDSRVLTRSLPGRWQLSDRQRQPIENAGAPKGFEPLNPLAKLSKKGF
jgi:hypothetical protein